MQVWYLDMFLWAASASIFSTSGEDGLLGGTRHSTVAHTASRAEDGPRHKNKTQHTYTLHVQAKK